ncbi:MAG: hypothetical protein ACRCSB_01385 [Bacteroidales bacterium]
MKNSKLRYTLFALIIGIVQLTACSKNTDICPTDNIVLELRDYIGISADEIKLAMDKKDFIAIPSEDGIISYAAGSINTDAMDIKTYSFSINSEHIVLSADYARKTTIAEKRNELLHSFENWGNACSKMGYDKYTGALGYNEGESSPPNSHRETFKMLYNANKNKIKSAIETFEKTLTQECFKVFFLSDDIGLKKVQIIVDKNS